MFLMIFKFDIIILPIGGRIFEKASSGDADSCFIIFRGLLCQGVSRLIWLFVVRNIFE